MSEDPIETRARRLWKHENGRRTVPTDEAWEVYLRRAEAQLVREGRITATTDRE